MKIFFSRSNMYFEKYSVQNKVPRVVVNNSIDLKTWKISSSSQWPLKSKKIIGIVFTNFLDFEPASSHQLSESSS